MTKTKLKRASHEERLEKFAQVAVKIGLRPTPGQQVIVTAPIAALPLVRKVTEQLYKAGVSQVTTLFDDDACTLARYRFAPDGSFDVSTNWLFDGMASAFDNNAARLAILGANPGLLARVNSDLTGRAAAARAKAYKPASSRISSFSINWSMISCATPAWAKAVFPGVSEKVAMSLLWDAIFAASRSDADDPIAAWEAHNQALKSRVNILNAKSFSALRFRGPGTDLTVGLADGHEWCGGATAAKNGVVCNANVPTEEVFTTPHCQRVNGYVSSTKPLSLQGVLVEGIRVRFEGGRVVEATAQRGQDALLSLIKTDAGACQLGEVALVPHSSPISQSKVLFYETLFDENAACHIAFGQSFSKCMINGRNMTKEELSAKGSNQSDIHVDWMIGSGAVDVDGICADGSVEAVMRNGEWV